MHTHCGHYHDVACTVTVMVMCLSIEYQHVSSPLGSWSGQHDVPMELMGSPVDLL